jgi:hypothetical protein
MLWTAVATRLLSLCSSSLFSAAVLLCFAWAKNLNRVRDAPTDVLMPSVSPLLRHRLNHLVSLTVGSDSTLLLGSPLVVAFRETNLPSRCRCGSLDSKFEPTVKGAGYEYSFSRRT